MVKTTNINMKLSKSFIGSEDMRVKSKTKEADKKEDIFEKELNQFIGIKNEKPLEEKTSEGDIPKNVVKEIDQEEMEEEKYSNADFTEVISFVNLNEFIEKNSSNETKNLKEEIIGEKISKISKVEEVKIDKGEKLNSKNQPNLEDRINLIKKNMTEETENIRKEAKTEEIENLKKDLKFLVKNISQKSENIINQDKNLKVENLKTKGLDISFLETEPAEDSKDDVFQKKESKNINETKTQNFIFETLKESKAKKDDSNKTAKEIFHPVEYQHNKENIKKDAKTVKVSFGEASEDSKIIKEQIYEKIFTGITKETRFVKVKLKPEILGEMTIELREDKEGIIKAILSGEKDVVKNILKGSKEEILSLFSEKNIKVEQVIIETLESKEGEKMNSSLHSDNFSQNKDNQDENIPLKNLNKISTEKDRTQVRKIERKRVDSGINIYV